MSPDFIEITDVSPRDGLQNQSAPVSTAQKLELIRRLAAAGVASVEAGSFVSPRAVPQMADSDAVVREALAIVPRVSALVPNPQGLERARAAGVGEVAVVLAATETMNRRNIKLGLDEAVQTSAETLRLARAAGLRTRAYLAVAFECPFEGRVQTEAACTLGQALLQAGADELVLADTIGAAAPWQVAALVKALAEAGVPLPRLAAHFHDTRGFGVANAYAALEAGVRRFDASASGIGGCPFAPGASGNLATEDLVLLAQQSGFRTGISLEGLVDVADFAQQLLGSPVGGRCMPWLRRSMARR